MSKITLATNAHIFEPPSDAARREPWALDKCLACGQYRRHALHISNESLSAAEQQALLEDIDEVLTGANLPVVLEEGERLRRVERGRANIEKKLSIEELRMYAHTTCCFRGKWGGRCKYGLEKCPATTQRRTKPLEAPSLRQAILSVLDDGPPDNDRWLLNPIAGFWDAKEVDSERGKFADAVIARLKNEPAAPNTGAQNG